MQKAFHLCLVIFDYAYRPFTYPSMCHLTSKSLYSCFKLLKAENTLGNKSTNFLLSLNIINIASVF